MIQCGARDWICSLRGTANARVGWPRRFITIASHFPAKSPRLLWGAMLPVTL